MKVYLNFNDLIKEGTVADKAMEIGARIATDSFGIGAPMTSSPTSQVNLAAPSPGYSRPVSNTVGQVAVDVNKKLSQNITLSELLESPTARSNNIYDQWMPNDIIVNNLTLLADKILEPIRSAGIAFKITSGWRSPDLNSKVGGQPNSYHLSGLGADLQPTSGTAFDLFDRILAMNLPVQEMFLEKNNSAQWVHIGYDPTMKKPKEIDRNYKV